MCLYTRLYMGLTRLYLYMCCYMLLTMIVAMSGSGTAKLNCVHLHGTEAQCTDRLAQPEEQCLG